MPGILGVAEPKKLGGQQRVNQKRWPLCWFFLPQGLPSFPVPGGQCPGLWCASSGVPDLPLITDLLPDVESDAELLQGLGGRMFVCSISSTLIPSARPLSAFSGPGELLGPKDTERKKATLEAQCSDFLEGGGAGMSTDDNNTPRSLWQRRTNGPGGAWRRPVGFPGLPQGPHHYLWTKM